MGSSWNGGVLLPLYPCEITTLQRVKYSVSKGRAYGGFPLLSGLTSFGTDFAFRQADNSALFRIKIIPS